jgi:hypothetical protein
MEAEFVAVLCLTGLEVEGELLFLLPEETMSPRNMNPDELDLFEDADKSGDSDEVVLERPRSEPEVAKEVDLDRDGLPDEPAKYRVPS